MDHRVSKDMISSGMTPSGDKSQADLGKSQYGSAPSPSRLMDAYHSMYQNQKEETLEEGKVNAGLQAYLDKKKGKKDDDDENGDEKKGKNGGKPDFLDLDKDGDKKESMKKASKEMKKEEYDNTKSPDYKKKKKALAKKHGGAKNIKGHPQYEGVDVFDLVSTKLIEEGYDEKDVYKVMVNLTEEQLNEFLISGTLAALGALKAGGAALAAKGGAALAAKGGTALAGKAVAGKVAAGAATKGALAAKSAKVASTVGKVGKTLKTTSSVSKPLTNVGAKSFTAPKLPSPKPTPPKPGLGSKIKSVAKNPYVQMGAMNTATSMASSNNNNKENTKTISNKQPVAAGADLFDIVKGKLLDEGLSEEEIKDIMLTLTPDEIIKKLEESSMSAGEGDDRHMGTDGVARTKQQVANMFNKNVPRKENTGGKVDKMTRKAINTTARDLKIQGPTTLKQSVEPKGDVI